MKRSMIKTLFLATLFIPASIVNAAGSDIMTIMKHSNPMPNLMQVIIKHGDELALSKEQNAALAIWRNENHTRSVELANAILADEKAVYQAGIGGKSRQEIQILAKSVMEKRMQMIDNKARCRDNMKKVLDNAQWQKVIARYETM
ncbi:MAG: hypothetical protein V3W04_03050 [Gammaproteobacteria bacterium]